MSLLKASDKRIKLPFESSFNVRLEAAINFDFSATAISATTTLPSTGGLCMRGDLLAKNILAFFCSICFVTRMLHQVVISLFLLAGMTFVYVIAIRQTEGRSERRPKAPQRDIE
jgi:hypothetical protein